MTNWLDLSNNANTLSSVYLQGFLDVSGSVLNRNTNENFVIAGDVSFSNNLYVQKDVSLNSNVYINGDISWNPSNFPSNSIMGSSLQNIDGAITSHLIPDTNETQDLGSSFNRFKDLYLSSKTLNLGNSSISATDQNAINLPSGSTMNNSQIGGITIKGLVASESALTSLSGVSAGDTYIADDTQYGYIAKTDNADTLSDWLNITAVFGITGTTGPRGDIGVNSSNTGDKGDKGSSIGPTGEIGEKGDPYTGNAVTGPKGIQGDAGVTGPINLTNNVVISKSLFVENDVSLNKNVDTNGQAYVYSFVQDATPYGGSTDISSVMGDFPTLRSNHSVSNANLWRATYTKTVDSYTGNDMWKNGDYTVTCSDFKQYYGAYSNPENAFSSLVIDYFYAWNSATGNIPIDYVDSNGNTQTLSDSTMNQWIALEIPIHVKVTSWTCYCTGYAGTKWHLLGRERKSGLIRDLHIGTQNYGLIDGNPSYKEQYITNNVSTNLFVDKLYFVFNGNLNNNPSVSIGNINFTGEMVPTSKSGLIVDGNASFTGTIDMSSFDLSANVLSINQTELSLDDITVSTNVNSNILVSTNNATNLLNMDVSENLTFDDNARLFVTTGVETHMNNELYVNKDTSLQKDLYVKGNIVSDGNINLSKYNNDYVIESNTNNYQVNTIETFEVKKNTNIANDTTISQNIFVDEDVSMNNGLFVKEDVIWDPTKLAASSIYNASLIGGGITGLTGMQGVKGDIGQKGDIGLQKLETVTGYRGSIGPKGVIGVKGEKHLANVVGSQGDTGYPDPHENLTLNGVFRIDGTLAIQNDLSWTPATTIAPNIIHPHCLSGYQSDMPDHTIALWSGSISNIPNGWTICDGTNNTPDLRSKFVIGHDSRDLSFNIDMSGASYLLDPVGTNRSDRNAFFIGDISDNGSWVDANGNKNATDAYNDNIYYTLAYIIKNIGATDVSNSFTFENYAKFEGDLSFNYDTPNGIDLRSIITTIDTNQTLENVTFNKDISINNTLTSNLYISANTINVNDTSLNVFTEKTNPINNIIVENKMKVGGNVNIPPDDTTTTRSMNYDDALQLSKNTFKSNRNEFDGNVIINNTIKTKNQQEGVNLVDPLNTTQSIINQPSTGTLGRFNTMAMNGEGNIIAYGSKPITSTDYPNVEGSILIKKLDQAGNWQNYGNEITTKFSSVDLNDDGTILAIGNKYADETATIKQTYPFYDTSSGNNTCDEHGYYMYARQYTNYKIYQDGEVKLYKYNDDNNTWETMNTDTGSSIVPYEPFQAFGNLIKLNKKGDRILIAPEGHGGYNIGVLPTENIWHSSDLGYFGGGTESRYRVAHVYEYNSNLKQWVRLGTPINVWDGECCGYEEFMAGPYFYWESRHDPNNSVPTYTYQLDNTLRTYTEHKTYADSIGMRLATIYGISSMNKIASAAGNNPVFIGNQYETANDDWQGNEVNHPTGSGWDQIAYYNSVDASANNIDLAALDWLDSPFTSRTDPSNNLLFRSLPPTRNVAEIRNNSGTKKLASVSRDAPNYAIYELYREYRELHTTTYNVPTGTYIQAGEDVPFNQTSTHFGHTLIRYYTITTERHYFYVNILKTYDEHKAAADTIYNPSNTDNYYHPHLINAFGTVSSDSRGKPFRAYQSLACIVDNTSLTEIQTALGGNTHAFVNCEYEPYSGLGWTVPLDTYPKTSIDDLNSLISYQGSNTWSRNVMANMTSNITIPQNIILSSGSIHIQYSYNSNIIHDNWHANEPKQLFSTSKTRAHVINIYKDLVDGRIKASGHTIGSTIENVSLQEGNVMNQTYDDQYNFYRIPNRIIAGETHLICYNGINVDIKFYTATSGSNQGTLTENLGISGIYQWSVPSTYADSNHILRNEWAGGGEGYHYYFGEAKTENHIKMRVTASLSNTSTNPYYITMKDSKLTHQYKENNHKMYAVYEKIETNTALLKRNHVKPNGSYQYPGGWTNGSGPVNMNVNTGIGSGVMFTGVEKLYTKIDSISFNDEGTIAAFGLTGVGQRDIIRRGMYRGAALIYRLKDGNVPSDASFNNLYHYPGSGNNNVGAQKSYEGRPHNTPDKMLDCWERIGVINGANNVTNNTASSAGFKYVGHFGSHVRLNGAGNILAVSARDSTLYSTSHAQDNKPGWITHIGNNWDFTDSSFNYTTGGNYSGNAGIPTDVNLGGIDDNYRAGYVQVFQYTNNSGDIITESNNAGSNDRWTQLGDTIIPHSSDERCGAGLAINKEGNILSVGGYLGYTEGQNATSSTRKTGMIRTFIFRHITMTERGSMTLNSGHWNSGKAHLGDASGNYSSLINFDINNKHWIQLGRNTLDFMGYDDTDKYLRVGGSITFSNDVGTSYRTKISNEMYPLNYHHYAQNDWTSVENTNYHTGFIFDGNYVYNDEMMNKLHNYYGKWETKDCNVVMNRTGTKYMTNTFMQKEPDGNLFLYTDSTIIHVTINSNHFQNTSIHTNQNNTRLVINKDISRPSSIDAGNDIEYTILDVSGNADINQNISTKHYNSIRSITVDIGTNSSSSKTVSFSYGKTYSDVSKLAFNVNVYSAGTNDNKQIDATIYNYTTTGAKLLVEASSAESDKTWSYDLNATVVIFETTDFTPVTPVYDYGTLYRYPPAAVPVAGDNGTSSFRGELQNANYGNGVYRIYAKKYDHSNADSTSGTKIHDLIDYDLDSTALMNSPDIYFYYEFPDSVNVRSVEIYLNNTTSCQVDVWKNETTFNMNNSSHWDSTKWNNIYDGSTNYNNSTTIPEVITMIDHEYKSTNIRIRLYNLQTGISFIQPRQIIFNVTF